MNDQFKTSRLETERVRGWIMKFLYTWRPNAIDLTMLLTLLDAKNCPLTPRQLASELDFLCGLELIRVFPLGAEKELDCVGQAKLTQKYSKSEGDFGDEICTRIRTNGVHFQEGYLEIKGVRRLT